MALISSRPAGKPLPPPPRLWYRFAVQLTLANQRTLSLERPVIVGVLNVTPDSFSDGGSHADLDAAVQHARGMIDAGADVIDVGGESTRPGAERVDADEQVRRVVPVIEALRAELDAPISVDSTIAAVAAAALDAGADIINDVSAGRDDNMFALVAERGVPIVLMHMLGEPATMQHDPRYDHVTTDVLEYLDGRIDAALAEGVDRAQIVIDPGIGFGKTTAHNLTLLADLSRFVASGYPVMLGASRKRFLGEITGVTVAADRAAATAATTALAVAAGVRLFRVHDVAVNRHAADVAHAVTRAANHR
ncbi:MAG: dihydropteroate synthase [Phycisphaera sp.]|nr:dihydropteroate synthase [Phycisphaera sp.]